MMQHTEAVAYTEQLNPYWGQPADGRLNALLHNISAQWGRLVTHSARITKSFYYTPSATKA